MQELWVKYTNTPSFHKNVYRISEKIKHDCFEPDNLPVRLDAFFNDGCHDIRENKFELGSELQSCCQCFK